MNEPLTDAELSAAARELAALRAALDTILFGQGALLENVITGLLARGHLLLERLPGLGKTELVKGLSKV